MLVFESIPRVSHRSPVAAVFAANRLRILAAYALFLIENAVELAAPAVLGFAIAGLLRGDAVGVALLAGQQFALAAVGTLRRTFDTRAYVRMYAKLATECAIAQRAARLPASAVAARAVLARQIVEFWERDVPFLVHFAFRVVGSAAWLALAAPVLLPVCLLAAAAMVLGSVWHARRAASLNRFLHDGQEREAAVVADADPDAIREHFSAQARLRIRLSDAEAGAFGGWQLVGVGVLVAALVCVCRSDADFAAITAATGYVVLFLTALANAPLLAAQFSRLCDVARRLSVEPVVR